ncbi:MAG: hypothetical protein JKY48_13325 [Flavobacteriales bacterium]|nr:hypothetical protein [Flavobacteriales bacterium]
MDEEWVFEVSGVNEAITYFEMTNYTDQFFVVENNENDFPKKIEYRLSDTASLVAIISDNENEIEFIFSKQ